MRPGALVAGVVVAAAALGIGVLVVRSPDVLPGFVTPEHCTATVGDHTATVDPEQAENAALIAAISVRREMPARAASIALATAFQESKLRNIEHGDRDSLGLFQQRPSQGWGSAEQILDPVHAINAFYDALEKVDGYTTMEITEAAQAVQRSGFPDAYAQHEADARALASALTGETRGGAFTCLVRHDGDPGPTRLDEQGLTRSAGAVRREVDAVFGEQSLGGFQPGGVTDGHMRGSAHYEGRAVDIFVRPISRENKRQGWAIAAYLVAQADRLDISTVIFDDRIWRESRSSKGWEDYQVPSSSRGDRKILEHRDHVHVDVR